jgi:single-stranded-DNA-specific exonuclease
MLNLPKALVLIRPQDPEIYQHAKAQGFSEVISRLLAGRPCAIKTDPKKSIQSKLADLDPPWELLGSEKAALRIVQAIVNRECIGLETDHDCDGQTAHAVIYTALVEYFHHPKELIRSYIGHRLKEGYGLSEVLANRILADESRPTLIITADNGSSDEPRIAKLLAAGIEVIVTDHHEIPKEGIPQSAYAVLNPSQGSCNYGDRAIAGCMVAWLLMALVRRHLIEDGHLAKESRKLSDLLDFVAVGTIADCVSMATSINNRAVVRFGLDLLNKTMRPCWRMLQSRFEGLFSCEGIAFTVAPLLNSDGRLESAMGSVSFLLAETDEQAAQWLDHLQDCNQERKAIQKSLLEKALISASEQYAAGAVALSIFLEEGHSGVHGIVASKIKEAFGRPCVMLAPKGEGILSASVRGIPGIHVRKALETVSQKLPGAIIAFGGHQGAAGLSLKQEYLQEFARAFDAAVRGQLNSEIHVGPIVWSDGVLESSVLSLDWVLELWSIMSPFGREFEAPVFEISGVVHNIEPLGKENLHSRLALKVGTQIFSFTWFFVNQTVNIGEKVRVLFSPKINYFRGKRNLALQLVFLEQVLVPELVAL